MKNVTLDIVLAEKIKAFIEKHQLKVNDKIPSNREFAEMFGVQRLTVSLALKRLQNEGLIFSIPRKGYFIAEKKIVRDLIKFESFTEMMWSKGLDIETKCMSVNVIECPENIARAFDILEGTKTYEIKRLRNYANKPLAVETSYIPEKYVQGLENQDLEGSSLYKVLEEIYLIKLCGATQEISMVKANEENSLLLDIPVGEALLLLKSVAQSSDGRRIEYSESLTRGDRCVFTNVLTREEV